jgi:hypothetical protein
MTVRVKYLRNVGVFRRGDAWSFLARSRGVRDRNFDARVVVLGRRGSGGPEVIELQSYRVGMMTARNLRRKRGCGEGKRARRGARADEISNTIDGA